MAQPVQQHGTTNTQRNRRSFYRLPEHVRKEQSLYAPFKISFGPYHYPKEHDEHDRFKKKCLHDRFKKKCLYNFLSRDPESKDYTDNNIDDFVDEKLEYYTHNLAKYKVRDMYDGLDDHWLGKEKDFLRMMVVDACCILEIIMEANQERLLGKPHSDAVFNSNDKEIYRHDMLLFENQIPFNVLVGILDNYKGAINIILCFFGMPPFKEEVPECLHILDVYRKSLLQLTKSINVLKQRKFTKPPVIPSATKLQEARIGITESKTSCLMDISFRNRTLSLPQLSLDACTESNFHNLVWFEKLDPDAGLHFSSYIYFISNLLKDSEDSNLLRAGGIIHTLWSDHEVVGLFKELGKNIDFNPSKPMDSELLRLGQDLRERYNKNSEQWRKDLFETYLKSPWAIISVFAAFLILSLTTIQTVYTVLGYYKP